jgi:hypothetical protein
VKVIEMLEELQNLVNEREPSGIRDRESIFKKLKPFCLYATVIIFKKEKKLTFLFFTKNFVNLFLQFFKKINVKYL